MTEMTAETEKKPRKILNYLCDILVNIKVCTTGICTMLRSATTENLGGLEFDLSMSLKVKCDVAIDSQSVVSY